MGSGLSQGAQGGESQLFLEAGCESSEFTANPESFLSSAFADGKNSATFSFAGKQVVALRGPEGARLIYDPASPVTAAGAQPAHIEVLLGVGTYPPCSSVLLMEGEKHVKGKKDLLQALSGQRLQAQFGVAGRVIKAGVDGGVAGGAGDIQCRANKLALEVSAACVLGITTQSKLQHLESITSGISLFDVVGDPLVAAAVRDALLALIEEATKSNVDMDIESSTVETEGEGESVLDVLMHSGDSLNCEETNIVCMHLFLLFWQSLARGFTKSIEALQGDSALLSSLAAEVAACEKDHTEAANVCEVVRKGSSKQLKFFVREIERSVNVAPLPWRRVTGEGCNFQDERLEPGTILCLATHLVHSSAQFNEPEKFDTQRFNKDRAEDKKNNGWGWCPHGTNTKTKGHRCASEELNYNTLKMFAAAVASLSVGGKLPSPSF